MKKNVHQRNRVKKNFMRLRLCGRATLRHIYAQVIDDLAGKTLVAASSLDKEVKTKAGKVKKSEIAKLVGQLVAKRAKEKGLDKVYFDRGLSLFHGRIKALADGAREGGLVF
ncbi:MAG: 50S ribosomal protein L18 [Candidatus Saganbacteria bacterium]|nr:50S ribosomal protein L18 [Candidatus Saganbacteria bacterium]